MNAESSNIHDALVDKLSSLDDRLDEKIDDVDMLADIQEGIARLLGSEQGSEAEIRRVLQERYEAGELRKETFQLVKSMLDRYVTEIVETSPSIAEAADMLDGGKDATVVMTREPTPDPVPKAPASPPPSDDVMGSTMVLAGDDPTEYDDVDARVQVGSLLRDRFMLQERLSGGSMGVVYKAMDRRLAEAATGEPWVAVKILSPQLSRNGNALRALQQEAAKGRCLVHPNIVRFIDLDRDDDLYFIVMEWLEGRTLADILDSPDARSIDKARAFQIVQQIGNALEYAHKCGIVHADVKPGNIMIMPNGDAKLFDFGVARVRQKQMGRENDFDPGVLGLMTPAYSSMQVLTGEPPVPSDDVFSLACLLYRLIAGYRVFGPRNAAEAAEEGMNPQKLDALNEAQWRILKKALSYSRVARFESMADFIEALDVEEAGSITVDIPAPQRFSEPKQARSSGALVIGLIVTAALGLVGANQLGYLDELKMQYLGSQPGLVNVPAVEESAPVPEEVIVEAPAMPAEVGAGETAEATDFEDAAEVSAADGDELIGEPVVEEPIVGEPVQAVSEDAVDEASALAEEAIVDEVAIAEPEVPTEPLVDFSQLPPPTAILRFTMGPTVVESVTVTLREGRGEATVDLIRDNVDFPLTLRLEEVGFSGTRSPWASGQYTFSDNGFLEFPVGQDRARITLAMTPDAVREADQQSTLRVREADSPDVESATINVVLEDDDQRVFESRLPPNTVGFTTSQVTVREQDPAVQLDIIRFNPGNTPMVVGYALRDITATMGEDYFAPGGYTIEFGPGQRSTRLLIPLVQDSAYEDNEAFSVELSVSDSAADSDVYQRVAVMIRDDDQ
ncbi:MAG: protein kinase [Woeseiaceae bacterium]|nr:protein kinase [Woeseiaceae bacterium]